LVSKDRVVAPPNAVRWIGDKGFPMWTGYGLTQTPAVQAGDLTLTAYVHEHRLAAARGGKEVWNVVAGGRIGFAPVVHQNLAIFGSHDGAVYAVHLADGSIAWRFLAAPADKRHVVLGQMESAWPVFGVALDEGKLYCSAGRHEGLDGGIHFYGLDPSTGKMAWHVKMNRGLETERTPKRDRDYTHERAGGYDGRPIFNDVVQVKDGKLWLFNHAWVDLSAPKDAIVEPETLVPPGLTVGARQ
jgi:outer membrane protein assembly factor BamB